MKDHSYHYRRNKPFPFGALLIGVILLMVFGMKLLLLIPLSIFMFFATRCFSGGGKHGRTVQINRYDDEYEYGERKRKPYYDDEDDDITYL